MWRPSGAEARLQRRVEAMSGCRYRRPATGPTLPLRTHGTFESGGGRSGNDGTNPPPSLGFPCNKDSTRAIVIRRNRASCRGARRGSGRGVSPPRRGSSSLGGAGGGGRGDGGHRGCCAVVPPVPAHGGDGRRPLFGALARGVPGSWRRSGAASWLRCAALSSWRWRPSRGAGRRRESSTDGGRPVG